MKGLRNASYFTLNLITGLLTLLLAFSCQQTPESETFLANASVCPHANCAQASVIQVTDQYYPPKHKRVRNDNRKFSAAYAEYLGFKYNIPLHVFEQEVKGREFEAFLKTGRGGASIYYPSCHEKFSIDRLNKIREEVGEAYGRLPTTLSYGCGKTQYLDSLPAYILGGRNSSALPAVQQKDAPTWYGEGYGIITWFDFEDTKRIRSRGSSGRYYQDIKKGMTKGKAAVYVEGQVRKAVIDSGFYMNFMHWHDWYKNDQDSLIQGIRQIDSLFIAMRLGIGQAKTAKVDYNEVVEYLHAKEAVDSISIWSLNDTKARVKVHFSPKREVDYSAVQTPITVKIPKKAIQSFKGHLQVDSGLTSVFSDAENYYLNLKVDFNNSPAQIEIEYDANEDYSEPFTQVDLSLNSNRDIIANRQCKFVLFKRKKDGPDFKMWVVKRSSAFGKSFTPGNLEEGYDYFCGAISAEEESAVIPLQ